METLRCEFYELTLERPLTKLLVLPKPLSSEGTSQSGNGLSLSPQFGAQSTDNPFRLPRVKTLLNAFLSRRKKCP